MKDSTPSGTAEHVATVRPRTAAAAGGRPDHDPYGAEWTGYSRLRRLAAVMPATAQRLSRPMCLDESGSRHKWH
jgi:hypothetical protein